MGMFDIKNVANVSVRPATTYLRAGIHTVKFMGVEKGDSNYSTIDFLFEDANGAVHTERLFEPQENTRKPNRFDSSKEDPSQAEQFMCKLMQIIMALNPDFHAQIVSHPDAFARLDFNGLIAAVQKGLTPKVGTEVQIKLLPSGRYVSFPGFPARIDRNGNLYLSTSFIGQDLTLSAYEKDQIDKALSAKPTDMSKKDDIDFDLKSDDVDLLGTPSTDDTTEEEDDGLPF